MIRKMLVPEVEIGERMAIQALKFGYADYENCYRPLADVHGVLHLGAMAKKDKRLTAIIQAAHIALLNIFDRMKSTGKVGASGDEIKILTAMLDAADDFWKRQSSTSLEIAIFRLREVRKRQMMELKNATKSHDQDKASAKTNRISG